MRFNYKILLLSFLLSIFICSNSNSLINIFYIGEYNSEIFIIYMLLIILIVILINKLISIYLNIVPIHDYDIFNFNPIIPELIGFSLLLIIIFIIFYKEL